jgi:hypothetical protein
MPLFNILFDDQQLFLFGLHTVTDEIEHLIQADGAVAAMISPHIAGRLSSLSVVSECLHQLHLFQPWARKIEDSMDLKKMSLTPDSENHLGVGSPFWASSLKARQCTSTQIRLTASSSILFIVGATSKTSRLCSDQRQISMRFGRLWINTTDPGMLDRNTTWSRICSVATVASNVRPPGPSRTRRRCLLTHPNTCTSHSQVSITIPRSRSQAYSIAPRSKNRLLRRRRAALPRKQTKRYPPLHTRQPRKNPSSRSTSAPTRFSKRSSIRRLTPTFQVRFRGRTSCTRWPLWGSQMRSCTAQLGASRLRRLILGLRGVYSSMSRIRVTRSRFCGRGDMGGGWGGRMAGLGICLGLFQGMASRVCVCDA